jgi:hypothetical protein
MCSRRQIADKEGFVHDLLDLNGDRCVRAASMQTRCSKFAECEWPRQKTFFIRSPVEEILRKPNSTQARARTHYAELNIE